MGVGRSPLCLMMYVAGFGLELSLWRGPERGMVLQSADIERDARSKY